MTQTIEQLQRYKVCYYTDEWGMSSNTPCLIKDPNGYAVRFEDVEQLQARVREIEEDAETYAKKDQANYKLRQQLAAFQLHAEQLRDALRLYGCKCAGCSCMVSKALALPRDTSALDAYVAEKVSHLNDSIEELTRKYQEHAGEKYALQDQIATLTRQRDLAVEALEKVGELMLCGKKDHLPGRCETASKLVIKTLSAIKESEVK